MKKVVQSSAEKKIDTFTFAEKDNGKGRGFGGAGNGRDGGKVGEDCEEGGEGI